MWPEFSVWGWSVPVWHLSYAVGALTAYAVVTYFNHKSSFIREDDLRWLFVLLYAASFLGARLFSYFVEEEASRPFSLLGSMTLYGGILAMIIVGTIAMSLLRHRMNPHSLSLAITIGCFVAVGIGRLGCFLNGDDYGVVIDPPQWWSIRFPGHDVDRVPVQLMEMVGCFSIAALGWTKWREQDHLLTVYWLLALYALLRFLLEFLRGDFRGSIGTEALSPAQILSLFMLAVTLILGWTQRNRH